ncbi:MAG: hypothetical protein ACOZQL_19755 [Myxococcota bacterium]
MKKLIIAVTFVASLAGCGGTVCDRLTSAQDKFFAGKTECTYAEGGSSITLKRSSTSCSTSACSAAEQKALDEYATCLSAAQACSSGNEKAATSAGTACALPLVGKVSAGCVQSM